jgi:hypothetical protein
MAETKTYDVALTTVTIEAEDRPSAVAARAKGGQKLSKLISIANRHSNSRDVTRVLKVVVGGGTIIGAVGVEQRSKGAPLKVRLARI